MKAVQMTAVRRPLELPECAANEPGTREVRVRVRAAGICHSDAHYCAGLSPVGEALLNVWDLHDAAPRLRVVRIFHDSDV